MSGVSRRLARERRGFRFGARLLSPVSPPGRDGLRGRTGLALRRLRRIGGETVSDVLIAAERYASLGLSSIPLKAMSKLPDLATWQQYQKRVPSEQERKAWFSVPRNLAILCGAISGGLVVLDFDDPRAFAYCFPDPVEIARKTLVVETGRGVHVYARLKGGGKPHSTTYRRRGKEHAWFPLDVQGEGKYAVAPPSVHESGKSYRFLGNATA